MLYDPIQKEKTSMINRRGIRIAFFLLSLAVSTALAGSTVVILAQCGMPSGRAANTNTQNNNTNPQSGMDMGNMDMSSCPCPYCKGKGGGGCAGEGGSCSLEGHMGAGTNKLGRTQRRS